MSSVLCRVCVNPFQESAMRELFDELNRPLTLATMLSEIGGIEVRPEKDEGLPKFCCQGCTGRLEEAHGLRKLCQESDKKLRKIVNTASLVKEETAIGRSLEEEPLDRGGTPNGSNEVIKLEAIELKAGCIPSDDDNDSDVTKYDPPDDPDDSDFEDEPKPKAKVAKLRKNTGKKKSTSKRKRITSRNKKVVDDCQTDQPITKPEKTPQPKEKTHQCSICGKFLSSKFLLKEHETTHLPPTQLPHQCHLCPKAYSYSSTLANHFKTHDPNHVFKCDKCDKVMKTINGLKSHLQSHSGEQPFKCTQCPKAYSRQSTLYSHVQRFHYKRKPFKCDLCPKAFLSKYMLKLHRGPAHEGVKLNPCPHCGNNYQSKNYLLQHIAERHPENLNKLMRCAFCGKGYHTNSHYRKHVVKYHPDHKDELEELLKQD